MKWYIDFDCEFGPLLYLDKGDCLPVFIITGSGYIGHTMHTREEFNRNVVGKNTQIATLDKHMLGLWYDCEKLLLWEGMTAGRTYG